MHADLSILNAPLSGPLRSRVSVNTKKGSHIYIIALLIIIHNNFIISKFTLYSSDKSLCYTFESLCNCKIREIRVIS